MAHGLRLVLGGPESHLAEDFFLHFSRNHDAKSWPFQGFCTVVISINKYWLGETREYDQWRMGFETINMYKISGMSKSAKYLCS
jgi:hypothetical protein